MAKRIVIEVAGLGLTACLVWRLRDSGHRRHALARAAGRGSRTLRYWSGRLQGLSYRLEGRHPDPDVSDAVLADRIRSSIGPLEKRLDLPRIHVHVEDHIAHLHGEMPSHGDAAQVEDAVAGIAGVVGIESYLHVGAIPDDQRARSADGRQPVTSEAHKRLVDSAYEAGAPAEVAPGAVRAVLAFLAERVPADELDQLLSHLPHDVRVMVVPPRRHGAQSKAVRTVPQLVASLAAATGPLSLAQAEHVVEAVFGTLRDLVPEEDHDIAAVLPEELREFWLASTPH